MKKKNVLIIWLVTLFLTACAGKEDLSEAQALAEAIELEEQEAAGDKEPLEVQEAAGDKEPLEVQEAAALETYEKGVLTENGWESKWLGIRYEAPEDATMLTEKELGEMIALGQEMLSEDLEGAELEDAGISAVCEMLCMGADGVTTLMVTVEKLPETMEIKDYASSFAENVSGASSMTYQVPKDRESVWIGEREFIVLKCTVSYNGMEICQDYYLTVVGDRAVHLLVTYTQEAKAEEFFNGFSAY